MIEHLKHFPKQFMWKPKQFAACLAPPPLPACLAPPLPYLAACLAVELRYFYSCAQQSTTEA